MPRPFFLGKYARFEKNIFFICCIMVRRHEIFIISKFRPAPGSKVKFLGKKKLLSDLSEIYTRKAFKVKKFVGDVRFLKI